MCNAFEQFFPEQNVSMEDLKPEIEEEPIPLRRITTGVSSIVGAENGDRPGGFILVADGAALLEVSPLLYFPNSI